MVRRPDAARLREPRVLGVVALVAVVVVALLWWLLPGGDDDGAGTDGSSATPSSGPTTSAPPASPGTDVTPGAGRTVPVKPGRTAAPVPLGATARFGDGMTVHLTDITPVQGEADGPGEVSGPALSVDLEIRNGSPRAINLAGVVVAAYSGADRRPAMPLISGGKPFSTAVPPQGRAVATYVFSVPEDGRDRFRVEFSYGPQTPTVVFTGDAR